MAKDVLKGRGKMERYFAIIIGLLFLFAYYGLAYGTMKYCGLFERLGKIQKHEKVVVTCLFIAITVWFAYLCGSDNAIPVWDRGFYWKKSIQFQNILFSEPWNVFKSIYQSINLTDYSDVVPAIQSMPIHFLGINTYTSYRVLLFVMYQIPSYIVIADIVVVLYEKIDVNVIKEKYVLAVFVCLCTTFVYLPTLYGLFDIADLLIAALIVLLLLTKDFTQFNIKNDILLSALFLVLLFIRRHYSFFALGYFGFWVFFECVTLIYNKQVNKLIKLIQNCVIIGIVCGGTLIAFFGEYLRRTLDNSYSVQYSARSYGGMSDKFIATFQQMGWLIIFLSALGIIALVASGMKKFAAVLVSSTLFILIMYFRIQSLSVQHYFNFTIQTLVLTSAGIALIVRKFSEKRTAIYVGTGLLIAFFAHGMVPSVNLGELRFCSSVSYQPVVRHDMEEVSHLVADVQKLTEDGKKAYCISSSGILNEDIFYNFDLPNSLNACPNLYQTQHTDMAGGFPVEFLHANYVIVTDPAQTHANYDGQRIIWALNNLVIDKDSIFANNYELISEYQLDDNVKAFVYEKVVDFTKEDYDYLIDLFNGWYPDYPELFLDRIQEEMKTNI